MTPAQRQYDLDLAKSMTAMAYWIEPRSRKVADTLKRGAERIIVLANMAGTTEPTPEPTQPASTPARGKHQRAR